VIAASAFDEELSRWNAGGTSDPAHVSNRPKYHPAARVLVELGKRSEKLPKRGKAPRHFGQASLLAEARNLGYWPFRTCFEEGLRRTPALNGATLLVFDLQPSGRVSAARAVSPGIPDAETRRCLGLAVRGLRFQKTPRRALSVDLWVRLWPGDAALPARAGKGVPLDFDVDALGKRFEPARADLSRCCYEAHERDPKIWGRIELRAELAGGRVLRAVEGESRFPDGQAAACMARALEALNPAPGPEKPQTVALGVRCGTPALPPAADAQPALAPSPALPEVPPLAPPEPSLPATPPLLVPPVPPVPPEPASPAVPPDAPPAPSPPAPPPPPAPVHSGSVTSIGSAGAQKPLR
jgi:hypothetical protein